MAVQNTWDNTAYKSGLQSDLNNQITQYQQMLQNNTNPNAIFYMAGQPVTRAELERQVLDLKNQLQNNMQAQGLVDNNGQLKTVQSQANQYVNKDYINFMGNQLNQSANSAQQQGLKQVAKQNLRGTGMGSSVGEAVNATDAIRRNNVTQMGQIAQQQQDIGYQKAGQEMNRAQNYAVQLTNDQRQQAQNQISMYLENNARELGLTQQQLQVAQQKLANTPDGLLVDLGKAMASGAGNLLSSFLFGVGGQVAEVGVNAIGNYLNNNNGTSLSNGVRRT